VKALWEITLIEKQILKAKAMDEEKETDAQSISLL
jgi:hypothetical protein